MPATERIELKGRLELSLPDGTVVRIQPGPYGKGISVVPQGGAKAAGPRAPGGRGRGRPPRPSTLQLREILAKDAAGGGLKESSHYIDWLAGQEPKTTRATLQQTVYREMRAAGGRRAPRARRKGGGQRAGRGRSSSALALLRERMQRDRDGGGLQDAAHYVRWVVDKTDMGIRQARPIVYRALRAAKA